MEKTTFRFGFSGWRDLVLDEPKPHTFTCPVCKVQLQPQNVMCIACPNCFTSGSKQAFSAVLKVAA